MRRQQQRGGRRRRLEWTWILTFTGWSCNQPPESTPPTPSQLCAELEARSAQKEVDCTVTPELCIVVSCVEQLTDMCTDRMALAPTVVVTPETLDELESFCGTENNSFWYSEDCSLDTGTSEMTADFAVHCRGYLTVRM